MNNYVGHKNVVKYFEKAVSELTLSHAYAFDGIKGIGKSTLARNIAKQILCQDEQSANFFDKNNHPDYLYIAAENGKILSENSQKIKEFLSMRPVMAGYKVVQIDDADKMNLILQNKLLKTIEEPLSDVIFFLISDNFDSLLDTVKSRLIRMSFSPLTAEDIANYAKLNDYQYDDELITNSLGSIARFLELVETQENVSEFTSLFDALLKDDNRRAYSLLASFVAEKKEDKNFMPLFESYVLKLIKISSGQSVNSGNSMDIDIAKRIGTTKLIAIIDEIIYAKERLSRNQNFTFVINYLIHKIKEKIDD